LATEITNPNLSEVCKEFGAIFHTQFVALVLYQLYKVHPMVQQSNKAFKLQQRLISKGILFRDTL
jgi:hypothetical protein